MNVAVTGSAGFIGSHLVEALKRHGDSVTGVDIKSDARPIDILDYHGLRDIKSTRFDAVYHLAACVSPITRHDDYLDDERAMMVNAHGTWNVLRAVSKDTLFAFSSTANLYGSGKHFDETSPLNISSAYGYSKAVAERMIECSGRPYRIFRFGTVVGPRGKTFSNRLVYCVVNGIGVEIFSGGSVLRNFVDVRDIVSGLLMASDVPEGTYNLASTIECSGKDLVRVVSEEASRRGYKPLVRFVDWFPRGFINQSTLDTQKISPYWSAERHISDTVSSLFDYYEQPDAVEPPAWDAE